MSLCSLLCIFLRGRHAYRNCCFDKEAQLDILLSDRLNLLPRILLPLCGPEEFEVDVRLLTWSERDSGVELAYRTSTRYPKNANFSVPTNDAIPIPTSV